MSVEAHRADSPASVPVGVVTVSDTRTPDTDTSGQVIAQLLTAGGHQVRQRVLVPDDAERVRAVVLECFDQIGARVVITTGGTGITRRDSTYEALTALFDKQLDGFGELFRMLSYQQVGAAAMLSRACAGVRDGRVVFLLPGSEAAVRLAMEQLILPELTHIVREASR